MRDDHKVSISGAHQEITEINLSELLNLSGLWLSQVVSKDYSRIPLIRPLIGCEF